jgi:hypothetical protein
MVTMPSLSATHGFTGLGLSAPTLAKTHSDREEYLPSNVAARQFGGAERRVLSHVECLIHVRQQLNNQLIREVLTMLHAEWA